MLRPALVLMLLLASVAQAATAMPPAGFPRLTLVTGGLKIESGGDGLTATRGGKTVWRTPGIVAFTLDAGPGRLITAQGFQLGPQLDEPTPRSLLIDPATGTLVASVGGVLVNAGSEAAIYLDLPARTPSGSETLLAVTRLPFDTLRPEVMQIGPKSLIPPVCMSAHGQADFTGFNVRTPSGSEVAKAATIQLGNLRCDLNFKLTFATLKVELLSFKPTR